MISTYASIARALSVRAMLALTAALPGAGVALAQQPAAVDSLILRRGEVVVFEGGRARQVTRTGGGVEDAVLSPDGRRIAYEHVLYSVPESGIFESEEDRGVDVVSAIVVVDRASGRIVAELEPPAAVGEGLLLDGWLDAARLFVIRTAPLEVTGFFVYDVERRTLTELDYASAPRSSRRERPRHEDPPPPPGHEMPRPPSRPGAIRVPGVMESGEPGSEKRAPPPEPPCRPGRGVCSAAPAP